MGARRPHPLFPWLVSLVLLAALSLVLLLPAGHRLEVTAAGPEGSWVVLKRFPVTPGDRLTLRFKHSVERTWVEEIFRVDERYRLVLEETRYESFGAGLPFDEPHTRFAERDGRFVMTGLERPMPRELRMKTLPLTLHELETPYGKILLYREEGPQEVKFTVQSAHLWEGLAEGLLALTGSHGGGDLVER